MTRPGAQQTCLNADGGLTIVSASPAGLLPPVRGRTERMPKWLEISLFVALPLVWGLAVEFLFEYRRRRGGQPGWEPSEPHD